MRLRRQEGQIIPALLLTMLALVAFGVLFFQVGRAAIFSTEAQTAADAAALAAARNVRDQLVQQVVTTGTSDLALIDAAAVRAAADSYAARNDGVVTRLQRQGVDVRVWVSTSSRLGRGAGSDVAADSRGASRARARLDVVGLPGGSFGAVGTGGGDPRISPDEWDALRADISSPPTCGTDASSNDLVKLTTLLRSHGFAVGENADIGDPPAPGVHSASGFHYRCRASAAIDVNWPNASEEPGVLDGLVSDVQALGFRTIWRAAGHFDHMHIDVAASGPIGAGFGTGGAVGGLEETALTIKLIDWDAPDAPSGFGGLGGGGFYSGPPDPAVARTICVVLNRYSASPKVRLAAYEAAIVESGVHNLPYGDRDSIGVYQQRPSQGWGTVAQIMNVDYAATQFITRAIRAERPYQSAGQLAQSVQRSAFPLRYDQVAGQALALLTSFCG